MIIEYAAVSFKGADLSVNSDQALIFQSKNRLWISEDEEGRGKAREAGFFCSVCNGINHGKRGKEAAESVINEYQVMLESSEDAPNSSSEEANSFLNKAIKRGHELLLQLTEMREDDYRMICSNSSLFVAEREVFISSQGHGRIYRFRNSSLELLTEDDTEGWALVKEKDVPLDELHQYPEQKNITKVLGGIKDQAPDVDVQSFQIEEGDVYLLCTHGFSDSILYSALEREFNESVRDDSIFDLNVLGRLVGKTLDVKKSECQTAILFQIFPEFSRWAKMIKSLDDQ